MKQSGFRAWKVFGGLAAAAMLSVGCGYLPDTGGLNQEHPPETFLGTEKAHMPAGYYDRWHYSPDRGYNGTIQQLGSSIDPRTPETEGTLGNSRLVDVTGRPAPDSSQLGFGGSGDARYVGEPESSVDEGWRARRGYDVGARSPGAFVGAPGTGQIPGP